MTNIDKKIEYAKAMGAERGGVVMDEDTVRQALLDIQKETAREMMKPFRGLHYGPYDVNPPLERAYKQITGEDYE